MARLFDDASSHKLVHSGAVLTARPITMAAFVYVDDLNVDGMVMALSSSSSLLPVMGLRIGGASNSDHVTAVHRGDSGTQGLATSSAVSANTWTHAAAIFATASSRTAYKDGVAGSAETTNAGTTTVDRTAIGVWERSSPVNFFSGRIAEAGIWNVELTANELAALAAGVLPLNIRPSALVAYWPLWGLHSPEIDLHPRSTVATDYSMTVTGATAIAHAPVEPFSRRFWGSVPLIEAGGGGAPVNIFRRPLRFWPARPRT